MAKCDRHIDSNDVEWCWKCQELTDKERFESIKSLNKQKEELLCEYSGLPSIKSYENQKQK
jgi:hypothetical protein